MKEGNCIFWQQKPPPWKFQDSSWRRMVKSSASQHPRLAAVYWSIGFDPLLSLQFEFFQGFKIFYSGWQLIEWSGSSPSEAVLGKIKSWMPNLLDWPTKGLAGLLVQVLSGEHAVQGLGLLGFDHLENHHNWMIYHKLVDTKPVTLAKKNSCWGWPVKFGNNSGSFILQNLERFQ